MSQKTSAAGSPVSIDAGLVKARIPVREVGAHKWGVGGVLIVGGSPGYIGAPALAAMAAGRSGAGVVSIASPRSAIGAIAAIVPEATFTPLPEGDLGPGGERAAGKVRESLDRFKALVIGPGLGDDEYANSIMQGLTGASAAKRPTFSVGFATARGETTAPEPEARASIVGGAIPAVLDADALNWLAGESDWSERFAPNTLVLTPHAGEMARLTGLDTAEIVADPAAIASRFAREWRQTVVLKGGVSVIASGDTLRQIAAPPALATAGSGDVLAGSIGAFLAQGLDPVDAASLALYLGAQAAERLSEKLSPLGVVASDLPLAIAEALAALH
ncbi:MAG: NAD(P)H-hydrate dehydratase [Thermomicrobiales bacterium]|nr:NAD(P)H-hydrate dehydratase [Thermomicrobiales bacterium]